MIGARLILSAVVASFVLSNSSAFGQTKVLIAPPRDISDITAILEQEHPDLASIAALRAKAEAEPPKADKAPAKFYYERAQARAQLARVTEAIADAQKAIGYGGDYPDEVSRYEQFLVRQYRTMSEQKRALDLATHMARMFETRYPRNKGRLFATYMNIELAHLSLGSPDRADAAVTRLRNLLAEARSWNGWDLFGTSWQANVQQADAHLLEAKGLYREAEQAFRRTQPLFSDAMEKSRRWPSAQPRADWYRDLNFLLANEGRMKARQGRLVEAENDIRRALLDQLRLVGKYHASTAVLVRSLASVLVDQGRLAEAEILLRAAWEIQRQVGLNPQSDQVVTTLTQLATVLELQHRHAEAAEAYADVDQRTRDWEPARRQAFQLDQSRIFTLYALGKVDEGTELARGLLARRAKSFGPGHLNTMYARGVLAVGLARAGNTNDALAEFRLAVPLLISAPRETPDDDTGTEANRDVQVQRVLETYVETLVRATNRPAEDVAAETFSLAETMRSRSVQRAITAAAARMTQPNEMVSKLARTEQDLDKQISANVMLLNRLLAQPQGERDDKAVQAQSVHIEKLKAEHKTTRAEIERRQPRYSELVDPKPPTARQVGDVLRPGEALLSFFFGRQSSFVWVLRNGQPAVLAAIPITLQEVERRIAGLREALEPPDQLPIPEFNVGAAADLYDLLLKPVESHWRGSKSLLLVTNGALGLMPLGLLPTSHVVLETAQPHRFSAYRQVPWLARTHAVTLVPSAVALLTLRRSPPGAANRDVLIGFGDPYFSATQAAVQMPLASAYAYAIDARGLVLHRRAPPATRSLNKADLAALKPLPDTALELKAVARTLHADPTKALHLGKAANEQVVKTANLARFRIIAFSTHGLLPNDLDGLTQPALALTAPDVAGVDGDGLLTMEEILGLSLDADWVLLSACNTAAGTSSGAEAASGLGRAFFYAGARALLVTNWSVDSASARDLVSGLFDRHVNTPGITRSEALRQAMMHLVDNGNLSDADGRVLFTYAHPLFWAPYSVIGDGTNAGASYRRSSMRSHGLSTISMW